MQAVSRVSCSESTKNAEDSSPEVAQEDELNSPTPVLDSLEGTSLQQTSDICEILSAHEDDVSESEKESLKECTTCAVMANKIRQLKNKLKSLQEKLIAVRREHGFSRRTGNFGIRNFSSTRQWIKLGTCM